MIRFMCRVCGKTVDNDGYKTLCCPCGSKILVKLKKNATKKLFTD